ncbi:hypothetical protein [Streptomyces misionensis]|uniref:hypothetical protein n=1 Tax=Streptomyces misionensis TaxID=67331 RepID=UPI00396BB9CA
MSAAEPAGTQPLGAVVDFTKRRRGGALRTAQGRWQAKAAPPPDPGRERSAAELFADDIEVSFNAISQSLTDPATAAAFLKTLDIWERALEGAHATGLIDEQQLTQLLGVVEGMRQAPRLV